MSSITKGKQVVLDEVDAVAGDINVLINNVDIIFVDVSFSFESADAFVEDRMGDCLFLLKGNEICPQFDGDEIDVNDGPKEGEDDDGDEEGDDRDKDNVSRFSH